MIGYFIGSRSIKDLWKVTFLQSVHSSCCLLLNLPSSCDCPRPSLPEKVNLDCNRMSCLWAKISWLLGNNTSWRNFAQIAELAGEALAIAVGELEKVGGGGDLCYGPHHDDNWWLTLWRPTLIAILDDLVMDKAAFPLFFFFTSVIFYHYNHPHHYDRPNDQDGRATTSIRCSRPPASPANLAERFREKATQSLESSPLKVLICFGVWVTLSLLHIFNRTFMAISINQRIN